MGERLTGLERLSALLATNPHPDQGVAHKSLTAIVRLTALWDSEGIIAVA